MLIEEGVFVGRGAELAVGERAVARALAGEGTLLLLSGEAGLGKTRLARAIGAVAEERGARLVWGRAWESGGAPSYWPWIQLFRALGAPSDPFAADEADGGIEVSQTRFTRFDRAARWLSAAADDQPIMIALDDLHAADVPSLLFLHFLARDLYRSRLLVVGTYRDPEARLAGAAGELLAKISREGTTIALDPLSRDDVLAWVCAATRVDVASAGAEAEADRIHSITEGNALFIHELLRVRGASSPAFAAKLPGMRALLDEHVARLTASTREVVEVGSVLGRDVDPRLVAAVADRPLNQVEQALREACDVGLLVEDDGRVSFAHILLRERLYAEVPPARRAELHGAVGERLVADGGDLATAAHHLFQSSRPTERIAEVARDAARVALARLAFEEAERLCERALAVHEADDALTFQLQLALAEAMVRAGKRAEGRAVCARVAERAQRLGSAEWQAQAALALALEQAAGAVDATMVETLREALEALPVAETPLRARLLARYAGSLTPPRSDEDAAAARAHGAEALALARRLGDPDTLLFALHHGGIGLGYLLSFPQRAAIMNELYELADGLGRPLVKLHLGGWRVATLREQGRLADADAVLRDYQRLVDEAPLPHYRWRVPMLRATLAALESDFDSAERLAGDALAIAEEGAVAAGRIAWAMCRVTIAQLGGEPESIAPIADRLEPIARRVPPLHAWLCAATGRRDEARSVVDRMLGGASYFSWSLFCAEIASLVDDADLTARAYDAVRVHAGDNSLLWGPSGVVLFGQAPRAAGDLASRLGRNDEARRWYDAAIALGERMNAPALVALARRGLPSRSGHSAPRRAHEPGITDIEIQRDGEMWRVSSSTGKTMRLKDSKGLFYLSHLVSGPRQEVHVTQLSDQPESFGDAGAVLDARAKAEYKRRVEELRDRLEEARAFNDFGRVDRLQAELEAIADQLAAAVGLGGRDRKMGSHAERARINIQRRIRDAIKRIAKHDPALGRYLDATVKTGMFCMFLPV